MAFKTTEEGNMKLFTLPEVSDEKVIKKEFHNSVCWSCLEYGDLKDMHHTHYFNGKPEVYAELLSYCFSIQVEEDGKQYLICDTCILRLRESANFRTQIEVTREAFNNMIEQKHLVFKGDENDFGDGIHDDFTVEEEWLEDVKPLVEIKVKKDKSKSTKAKITKERALLGKKSKANSSGEKKIKCSRTRLKRKKNDDESESCEAKEKRDKGRYKEPLPYTLEKTDLECKICGEKFAVHKSLQMHMPSHFPNHICDQCGRWFATRTQLKTHSISHTTQREACPICPNRVFKATGGLKAHMRTHAGDKYHYKCKTCNLQFKTFNERRRHFVSAHGEEDRKYECKHCPRRFSLPSHLSSHIRRDHLQERAHTCSECSSSFFDRRSLKMHMLKHSGEKNFECNICHKKYGRKYTLVIHSKTHLGIRPWKCDLCAATFTQKCSLKGHMATHSRDPNKNCKP